MAWTSPRTWVAGETVTAALLNTHLRDNLKAAGDPWTTYAPTITNVATSGVVAKYREVGKTIDVRVLFNITGAPTGEIQVSLPVTASTAFGTGALVRVGVISGIRTGVAFHDGRAYLDTSTTLKFNTTGTGTVWNATVPVTWATGDDFHILVTYEAA